MRKDENKISVVIPMFNSEESIERALDSVVNQSFRAYEIIIINDGSTDGSLAIVENYRKKSPDTVLKIVSQGNSGVSKARNAGMRAASGDYIALLDADDEWLPNKLEMQMNVLEQHGDIDFLGCARNGEVLKIFWKEINSLHKATVRELLIKMYPQTSTAIFKRSLFVQLGGYNEDMTHAEDGHLWITYCAGANFYYMPDSLVITGSGKPSFGHSGLSSNLKAMHNGNKIILRHARKKRLISAPFFFALTIFGTMKYLRRILITNIRVS